MLLQVYLIQTDPKGCPKQSILAIMTELSANNHIVSQPITSSRLIFQINEFPLKTNSCINNTDKSVQKGIIVKSAVKPSKPASFWA